MKEFKSPKITNFVLLLLTFIILLVSLNYNDYNSYFKFLALSGPISLWFMLFLTNIDNYFFQIHQQNEEILKKLNEK
jgi:hypothetical protein